jgi:hypothetical protein
MLLAVIPVCATYPMDRLLMFVGLGAFGLLVRLWSAALAADARRPGLYLRRAFVLFLVFLHIFVAPLLLTVRAAFPFGPRELADVSFLGPPFDETIEQQDLIVVNSPVSFLVGYWILNYEQEGMASPRSIRALAPGSGPVTVKRTDDRTLEAWPHGGYLSFPGNLFRNEQHPLQVGEQVHLARMTATVLEVEDARPRVVAFRFESSLEHSSLRWLRFQEGEFVRWTPPRVGDEVTLE